MSVALVTGSSSGIGLATALETARRGHRVFAATRGSTADDELKAQAAAEGLALAVVTIDVTSDDSVRAGVDRVVAEAGRMDVLVNNAGISVSAPLEDAPMRDARRILEVNYFGAVRMIQAALPVMRAQKQGRIVNVSSISGRVSVAALGHYSASKAALEAASESLAQEVAPLGIRVVLVEPGVTQTPMFTRRTGLRPIDPNTPYMPHIRRLYGYFGEALKEPLHPDDVARVIADAATADNPRFRYLLGRDALGLMQARERSTDEEWIEIAGADDAEFAAFVNQRAGIKLY